MAGNGSNLRVPLAKEKMRALLLRARLRAETLRARRSAREQFDELSLTDAAHGQIVRLHGLLSWVEGIQEGSHGSDRIR